MLLLVPYQAARAGDELVRLQQEARSGYDGAYIRAGRDFSQAAVARLRHGGDRDMAAYLHGRFHAIDVERAAPVKTWLAGQALPKGVELSPLSDVPELVAVFERVEALPADSCKGTCEMSLIGTSMADLMLVVYASDSNFGQFVGPDVNGKIRSIPLAFDPSVEVGRERDELLKRLESDRITRLAVSAAVSVAVGRRAMVTCDGQALHIEHFDDWQAAAELVRGTSVGVVSMQLHPQAKPALNCDPNSFGAVAFSPPLGPKLAPNRRVDPWLFAIRSVK